MKTAPNRLIHETSPYLLQHAHNPVDWYPWGDEAFERARSENKPVFLSIGYSACHWCHVMERESFEDAAVAEILNRDFVAIKVDREERPDVDSIYMQAVQMMTGHGGWPMSMFLTPSGVPFYGGTYFPPDDRHGMPSFRRVLHHVREVYRDHPDRVAEASEEIRNALSTAMQLGGEGRTVSLADLDQTASRMIANLDRIHGGFGGAPKFPPSMSLEFLLQVWHRSGDPRLEEAIDLTLRKMAGGGMYDHVGGGFHRYSVDARWLVPHFEKMLYDNALLARLYVHAWQKTKNPLYSQVVRETLGFVIREMTSESGGFYSTLDADSEGVEGKFYVWSRAEILDILGEEEGRHFAALYDVTDRGNWEGTNILNMPRSVQDVAADLGVEESKLVELALRGKCRLYGEREKRVRPGRDEKILAGWNGWMLAAFSEAALAFDSDEYRGVVRRNADFLIAKMIEDERLYRSYKDGTRKIGGLLEDYSGVAWGLIAAFEATQERRYLDSARQLAQAILSRFHDRQNGGFFDTPDDHEALIARPKDLFDNATPSGNSVAIHVLQKLSLYFGDPQFARMADTTLAAIAPVGLRYPSGFGFFLCCAEWGGVTPKELAITGGADREDVLRLVRVIGEEYVPHKILVWSDCPDLPLMEQRSADAAAAYVCEGYRCLEPTSDPERLRELLRG